MPKNALTSWSQMGLCNKPTKLQFHSIFNTVNIWCSQNTTNQPKSFVELGYMCPRELNGPPADAS